MGEMSEQTHREPDTKKKIQKNRNHSLSTCERVFPDAVVDESVLLDGSEDETSSDQLADLDVSGDELPDLGVVKRLDVDSAGHEHRAAQLGDGIQRALNSVEDVIHDSRAELHLQRGASALHGVSDRQTSCTNKRSRVGRTGVNTQRPLLIT